MPKFELSDQQTSAGPKKNLPKSKEMEKMHRLFLKIKKEKRNTGWQESEREPLHHMVDITCSLIKIKLSIGLLRLH